MADIWTEFSDVVKSRITSRSGFTGEFYTDIVPADTTLPYAIITESLIEPWMTFSNLTAGEEIYFRVLLANDVRNGGITVLKTQTEEVVKALHLKVYENDNFIVESSKRTEWSKPFIVEPDEMQWKQYVDFSVRIKYKKDSDYYTDFSL